MTSTILKWFLAWQASLILIMSVAIGLLPIQDTYLGGASQAFESRPLINSRANFDGNHYVHIAMVGYGYAQQAFFPLYPRVINLLSYLVGDPIISGILISIFSFFAGLLIFYQLIILDEKKDIAKWAILSLLFFPTSFYFSFVYTEGLFFFLIVLSTYLCRKQKWFAAAIVGMVATYCRINGILLLFVYTIELFSQKKACFKNMLIGCAIPIGLVVYMTELSLSVHDPLAFLHVQALFNQGRSDHLVLLPQVFWRYIKILTTSNRQMSLYFAIILEFISAVAFFWISIMSWIRLRKSYTFFLIGTYILPTLTGSFTSLSRYVIIAFPAFILLGKFFSSNDERLKYTYIIGSTILVFTFLTLFINGYWVA